MYSTWVQKVIFGLVNPVGPRVPIDEQLRGQGVQAERVDAVVFRWGILSPFMVAEMRMG